jgi:hypothetical protein
MNYADHYTELRHVELDTKYGTLEDVPVYVHIWYEGETWHAVIKGPRPEFIKEAYYRAEVLIEDELNHTEE